jgi:hypothetical protein
MLLKDIRVAVLDSFRGHSLSSRRPNARVFLRKHMIRIVPSTDSTS